MLLIAVVLYLILTVLVGFWASRKVRTSDDYMLAGRRLPLLLGSTALFATWFGSETVFGASSEFLKGGLLYVIEDPFGAALCLLLFGMFFARKLYRMNLLTLGDFFRVRFGRSTELIASIFLAPPYVGYIAAQLVAMGLILQVVAGVDLWLGIVISSGVVTAYTYVGGMWAITITDFVQTLVIISGLLAMAIALAGEAGGVFHVIEAAPPDTFHFLPSGDFNDVMAWLAAWAVLGLGSIPSQDVFQRAMSSRSARVAEWSCYVGAGLYLTIALIPLFIALCVRHLYPGDMGNDTQLALPTMVLTHMSLPLQVLFFGSLLSAIMSTTSSAILAPASIVSGNIVKPLSRGSLNDAQLLAVTRGSVLVFSVLACGMALMRSNIYELVAESSILSLVSLFIPLTLGMYWKGANGVGAISAMVLGMVTWIIFEFYETPWPSLIPATLMSTVAMVAGSLLTTRTEYTHDTDRAQSFE